MHPPTSRRHQRPSARRRRLTGLVIAALILPLACSQDDDNEAAWTLGTTGEGDTPEAAAPVSAGTPPAGVPTDSGTAPDSSRPGSDVAQGGSPTGPQGGAPAESAGTDGAAPMPPSAGSTGASGAGPDEHNADAWAEFIAGDGHRAPPWLPASPEPREASSAVSPHGRLQVWFNDVLQLSQAEGNGEFTGTPHAPGSMVVAEFYDVDNNVVGVAAMLKFEGTAQDWTYYCDSNTAAERCGAAEPLPVFSDPSEGVSCNFCHGGLVFSQAPNSDPQ